MAGSSCALWRASKGSWVSRDLVRKVSEEKKEAGQRAGWWVVGGFMDGQAASPLELRGGERAGAEEGPPTVVASERDMHRQLPTCRPGLRVSRNRSDQGGPFIG